MNWLQLGHWQIPKIVTVTLVTFVALLTLLNAPNTHNTLVTFVTLQTLVTLKIALLTLVTQIAYQTLVTTLQPLEYIKLDLMTFLSHYTPRRIRFCFPFLLTVQTLTTHLTLLTPSTHRWEL